MSAVSEWLDRHNARMNWHTPVRNVGTVACYSVGEAVALVLFWQGNRSGWDLFVPASLDTDIAKTLKGAEKALRMKVHRCCDPDCPGFPYAASERAHPCGRTRALEQTRAAVGDMLGMDLDDATITEPKIPFMPPGWTAAQHFIDSLFFGVTERGSIQLASFSRTRDSLLVIEQFADDAAAAAYVMSRHRNWREEGDDAADEGA